MRDTQKLLEMAQVVFSYTDDEMRTVASNPQYMKMLSRAPQLLGTEFIFKIDGAHGCACQHQKGQKITIDGDGAVMGAASPAKICVYLLNALTPIVYGAQEFIYAGLDPNELTFTQVGCFDNGVKCGGLGHVSVRFSARQKRL